LEIKADCLLPNRANPADSLLYFGIAADVRRLLLSPEGEINLRRIFMAT
jgi:hypothetical protein